MTDRLRIMFAIGSLAGGGAERQVVDWLRRIDRRRFEPSLYLVTLEGPLLVDLPEDVPIDSFDARRPPLLYIPGRMHRRQAADLAQTLWRRGIDVLCSVTYLMSLIGQSAVRRRRTPLVAIETSDPRRDFSSAVGRFAWIKKRLMTRAYARAEHVVAVSPGVRDGIVEFYGLDAGRVTVLPNCIDLERIDRLSTEGRRPFPAGGFHVVAVGRLQREKGHIHLLEAVERLVRERGQQALQLHLVGSGPLEAELRQFVAARQLESHVSFAGFVSNPYLYLAGADLFCLPSLYEGLPLALLEALACRTPVVVTDCAPGLSAILDDGRLGRIVPPGDSAALADAIEHCLVNHDAWHAAVEAGRRRVETQHALDAGMIRFEELLQSAARRPDE